MLWPIYFLLWLLPPNPHTLVTTYLRNLLNSKMNIIVIYTYMWTEKNKDCPKMFLIFTHFYLSLLPFSDWGVQESILLTYFVVLVVSPQDLPKTNIDSPAAFDIPMLFSTHLQCMSFIVAAL